MFLACAFYLTLSCVFASDTNSSISDNDSVQNNITEAPHQNIKTARDDVDNYDVINLTQGLLDLLQHEDNSTAIDNDQNDSMFTRRFSSWIQKALGRRTTTTTTTVPPTELDEFSVLRQLVEVLKNATEVIEKLNSNIEMQNPLRVLPLNENYYEVIKPKKKRSRRGKREAPLLTEKNKDGSNVTVTNSTVSPAPENILSNTTIKDEHNITPLPSRRTESIPSNPAVKNKLLTFLNDTFLEIAVKVKPVAQIKKVYAKEFLFKIGYIVANIDTLEVSISNLKKDMDKYKEQWGDEKVLELFDKIVVSNKVITNLMDSLNVMHIQNPN